ncbi:MAG: hypothetical protein QHJ34_10515 [bacterium]|jgi:uncharacterized membrane protein HdeD (DUF308 family)|nr:DUF3098 domain-containing protein [candidate division KSB1 bacterium]MDH7560645.1 hypothetical protein [bacterium]
MRKEAKRQKTGRRDAWSRRQGIALGKTNYLLAALGLIVIVIGYVCLAQPPVNGFLTLTVAPILLVAGYCVIMPLAILWRGKDRGERRSEQPGTTSSQG